MNKKLSILLVEDNDGHAELIERAFESSGDNYELFRESTVAGAEEFLSKNDVDIVFTDLILEDGRGTQLLEKNVNRKKYPFVIFTSQGSEEAAVESIKAGAFDYLVKTHQLIAVLPGIARRIIREWENVRKIQQAEESLEFERRQVLSIFDGITNPIYVSDPVNYKILFVNKCLIDLIGENPTGKLCYKMLQGLDEPCEFCTNSIILENKNESYSWEYYNPVLDKYYMLFDKIIKWPGNIDARFELALDITDRKLMEKELLARNTELADFAHRVSHDLKSPINVIKAYIEAVEDDPALTGEFFPRIKSQADFLLNFIERLLFLSRAGRVVGSMDYMNVEQMAGYAFKSVKNPEVDAFLEFSGDSADIYGDVESILQVFINLFENSFKYRDAEKDRLIIKVDCRRDGEKSRITVSDNGIGIDPQHLDRIFSPGYALSKEKGTGFGLSICKKIIQAHKGDIRAKSKGPGEGTRFIIELPAPVKTPA